MGRKIMQTVYGAPAKNILAMPDHYVAIAHTVEQTAVEGNGVVKENGRFIVKGGTIFPTNDANARGVVLTDVDVTDGDDDIALIIHGFVLNEKLPVKVTDEAKAVLKQIEFINKVA